MNGAHVVAFVMLLWGFAHGAWWFYQYEKKEAASGRLARRLRKEEADAQALVPEPVKGWGEGAWPLKERR